jgi:prolyl-tRNA editing enzyme YbaK/EbsC (Cys-tRNA(Pro) deacylase)
MTNATELLHPAVIESLKKHGIAHEIMPCDPEMADTAAFCEHYKISLSETANCIIAVGKSDPVIYACCVVLATCKLDVNKKLSQLLGIKRCSFASGEQTLELTGMMIGGVTPFGVPELPIYIDAAVMNCTRIVLGGGNRSSKLLLDPNELRKLSNVQIIEALGIPK